MLNNVRTIIPGYDISSTGAKNVAIPLKSKRDIIKEILVVHNNLREIPYSML